ncbi:MAG: ribosome biogenesis GTPase Der [Chloroflexi bacterium]|nr:ribosome biogenesis GTPase Der [Chloroflexota bacterium]
MVVIVGRPNVGKSTLFNRLVGRRKAIVEDLPGTTRDRISADIQWDDRQFTLVDTGGLEISSDSDITQRVRRQVELAIAGSDAVIFLVDARDGVTATDLDISEVLRRSGKPVVLAANKVDNEQRRTDVTQFYELGVDEVMPISAYHGTGIDDLMDATVVHLPSAPGHPGETTISSGPKIAILGRPNVGKSALLNAILGEERVIVSEVPGTTRDAIDTVVEYEGERTVFIDTAGIRRRGRIEGGVEKYSVIRAMEAVDRADVILIVLDASELITAQDAHIAGYVVEAWKGIVIVVNKWDLARELGLSKEQCDKGIRSKLKFLPYASILYVSALLKEGVKEVLAEAKRVAQERLKRVPTARLNNVVGEAVLAHRPPAVSGKRLKILYATQADVNPPTFVFSVNDPELVHFSYQRYLENRLREAFGFSGTPLRFVFRKRGEQRQNDK